MVCGVSFYAFVCVCRCTTNGIALLYIVGNVRPAFVNHTRQTLFRQKQRGCEAHGSAADNVEGLPAETLKLSLVGYILGHCTVNSQDVLPLIRDCRVSSLHYVWCGQHGC